MSYRKTSTRNAGRGPATSSLPPGQTQPTAHLCPASGCREPVRADRLMCRAHWYRVPKPLRDAVWATWRSGDGAGSPAHTAAIRAAVAAVDTRRESHND